MPSASPIVGSYSRQTVARMSGALIGVWNEMNRDRHRDDTPENIRSGFELLADSPLLQLCREARDEGGEPLNQEHDGANRIRKFLSRRDGLKRIPDAFSVTVTDLAEAVERTRQMAKVELNPKLREQYDIAFKTLKRHLAALLETGFLAELPVSSKLDHLDSLVLERLASTVYERWHVIKCAAEAPHFERWICRGLGMSLGLGAFDSVRAQEWGHAEGGMEGIVRYLDSPIAARRKRLVPTLSHSVDQAMRIAFDLRGAAFRAPAGSRLRENRFKAALVAWITVVNLLRTRYLIRE